MALIIEIAVSLLAEGGKISEHLGSLLLESGFYLILETGGGNTLLL